MSDITDSNNENNEPTPEDVPVSDNGVLDSAPAPKRSLAASALDYVEIFVFAICFVILMFSFVSRLCTVIGPSMEDTLTEGELLLVSNVAFEPEYGNIIVFHQTGTLNEPVVKRVIATSGETVDIDFDTWTVTVTDVNGVSRILNESYMKLDEDAPLLRSILKYPYTVPEGYLFVMGDNRNHSSDSRGATIGLVDERRVLGRVILRITPFSKFGTVK